ncbi:hypothetical protein IWZ00DRAFT_315315 [Phyllosticta capitalensis]|uniref:uncharacterized protein n=1 Tax=Phyllosticta capitalensis TaxID=121624 RepID=UPI00312D5C60
MSTTSGFPENPVHPSVHPAGPQPKGERHIQKIVGAIVVSGISLGVFIGIFIWIFVRRRRFYRARANSAAAAQAAPTEVKILPVGLSENFSFKPKDRTPKVSVIPPTPDTSEGGQKYFNLPNVSEVLSGPAQPALAHSDEPQTPKRPRQSWAKRASFRLSYASMGSNPSPRTSVMPMETAKKNLINNMAETGTSDPR